MRIYLHFISLLTFFVIISCSCKAQQKVEFQGQYKGTNIYIQNPYAASGIGFCIDSVWVNEVRCMCEINSSAFEIDLDSLGYKIGDKIRIILFHKDDCKPRKLHTDHGRSINLKFGDTNLDANGVFTWTVKEELNRWIFIVEQFRWTKWVKIGEVEGLGKFEEHDYQFQAKLHSGVNKIRVKIVNYSLHPTFSKFAKINSNQEEIKFTLDIEAKIILFTDTTMYEIYDEYSNIVYKGESKMIDLKKLKRRPYELNYDNKMAKISLKRRDQSK